MRAPCGGSLALLTDLYQLTMAFGYWREGLADREAVFCQYFREAPFGGSFAIAAGLGTALDWLAELRFSDDDIAFLASLKGADGTPLFEAAFLDYLGRLEFACDVDAIAEGSAVFAHEPLLRVRGPLLQCQLVETALLNIINFQTLVATKAARVCLAAGDDPVLEFGLRRAQGIDGGLSASRAAYIGGCAATSNVLAGKLHGIPVRGTHGHSWVLAFGNEREAFHAFARAMPHNCVLLVDTFDTLEGVRNAIDVGVNLRENGAQLAGIRLDSGDLADLSIQARTLLDEAGLQDTAIVASNDLDEDSITALKRRGAKIGIWGVGTSIASSGGQSALGGVYKLTLMRDTSGQWQARAKRSEESGKASLPGMLQVRRYTVEDRLTADLIYDELHPPPRSCSGAELESGNPSSELTFEGEHRDLLQAVVAGGQIVAQADELDVLRLRCRSELAMLPDEVIRARSSGGAPVWLEDGVRRRQLALLA